MPVKLRLQRHGKKGKPFYWIVAADSRAKRDGKFLEKVGTYDPNTNPATIDLNLDSAVKWLHHGAQPTETTRAILSYKGALLKHHLDGGVRKGALTQEQAEEKLAKWLEEKYGKVTAKKERVFKEKTDSKEKALAAEKEINQKRITIVSEDASLQTENVEETIVEVDNHPPVTEEQNTSEE